MKYIITKEKAKEYKDNFKRKHPDYSREYYQKHKKAILESNKRTCTWTKEQKREYGIKWRKENKDKIRKLSLEERKKYPDSVKKWKEKNKDRVKIQNRLYKQRNKEKIRQQTKEYDKKYKIKNRDRILLAKKEYRQNNKGKIREYLRNYEKKKLKGDISFRISKRLSGRIRQALKQKKSKKTKELIGCSLEYLKDCLESQFDDEMSWANYGKWHIDHIIPCASFDLSKEEEQKKCFNHSNLQPLWAKQNWSKGAKI